VAFGQRKGCFVKRDSPIKGTVPFNEAPALLIQGAKMPQMGPINSEIMAFSNRSVL